MQHAIDAKGKSLGRVASTAAALLLGKSSPDYQRNKQSSDQVVISNAALLKIRAAKERNKKYLRHSGFPGGQKIQSLGEVIRQKGHAEALRRAVYGMLPKNNTRDKIMKRLVIEK